MAASGESSRKLRDRKGQTDPEEIDDLVPSASGTDANELETIPTKVPREGDGYQVPRSAMIAQGLGRIGEPADVTSGLAWLLDPAQQWVTGQIIGIDGGLGSLRSR